VTILVQSEEFWPVALLAAVANRVGRTSALRLRTMQKRGIAVLAAVMVLGVFFMFPRMRPPAPAPTVGIGVAVIPVHNAFQIIGVLPGTSAARAGLHPGMFIEQVDRISITGTTLARCLMLMRGPAGSTVLLKVIDPVRHTTNVVECVRAKIVLPADNGP
jgi:predicted metalloprotease with PDZ domain